MSLSSLARRALSKNFCLVLIYASVPRGLVSIPPFEFRLSLGPEPTGKPVMFRLSSDAEISLELESGMSRQVVSRGVLLFEVAPMLLDEEKTWLSRELVLVGDAGPI
jgi:hypothetical protein